MQIMWVRLLQNAKQHTDFAKTISPFGWAAITLVPLEIRIHKFERRQLINTNHEFLHAIWRRWKVVRLSQQSQILCKRNVYYSKNKLHGYELQITWLINAQFLEAIPHINWNTLRIVFVRLFNITSCTCVTVAASFGDVNITRQPSFIFL